MGCLKGDHILYLNLQLRKPKCKDKFKANDW